MNDDQNIKFSKGGVEPEESLKDDDGATAPTKPNATVNDADDADSAEPDLEDVGPGRVYDFSDDLNILPVKDEENAFNPEAAIAVNKAETQPSLPTAPVPKPPSEMVPPPAPSTIQNKPAVAAPNQNKPTTTPGGQITIINELKSPAPPGPSAPSILQPQAKPQLQSKPFPQEPVKQSVQFPAAIVQPQTAPKPYMLDLDHAKSAKPVISQPQQPAIPSSSQSPISQPPIPQTPAKKPEPQPIGTHQIQADKSSNYLEPLDQGSPRSPSLSPYAMPIKGSAIPIQKDKTVPANPPAKKISLQTSDLNGANEDKRNLQETAEGMMPGKQPLSEEAADAGSGKTNKGLKPLRTYEGDVADVLSKRKVSTATIAIAESKKENKEERIVEKTEQKQLPQKKESRHIFLKALVTIISLCLIGGGLYSAYYLYSQSILAPSPRSSAPQQSAAAISSIVPADSQASLPINDIDPNAIASEISAEVSKPQPPDTIKNIVLTQDISGQMLPVDGPGMLTLMQLTPPDALIRSLTAPWMLGVYADQNGQRSVFVVATTDYFQGAFAGMLAWENVMPDDLRQFLYPSQVMGVANAPAASTLLQVAPVNPAIPQTGSTTATSSIATRVSSTTNQIASATTTPTVETVQPYTTIRGQFSDHVILNKDVREFRTTDGTLVFLYSFINNNELVFTTSETALSEIVTRLEK